jgi:hypothetical protein
VGFAGLVVGLDYGAMALHDLWDSRTPIWSRLLVVFVTWSLALSAFYMAYKFLNFARFGRKSAAKDSAVPGGKEQ